MPMYLIGDLQGCNAPLGRMLETVGFSPSRDTLFLLGDLVNRGPDSLAVLRRLSALGDAARCLLGNHDLHLLAMWQGVRKPGRKDTSQAVLSATDGPVLLDWLRHRQMAMEAGGWLMVHAGVLPAWTRPQTLALAAEVETALRGPDLRGFMREMYGNLPARWSDTLTGADRLRVIVNALTRLRFCTPDGLMEFEHSGSADEAPPGYLPWFEVPNRATRGTPIAFGHWSTLGKDRSGPPGLKHQTLALDTGCVWGGCLSAARISGTAGQPPDFEIISVECEEAQKPG